MDAGGGNEVHLTDDPASDGDPAWSPDGTRIAFDSNAAGNSEVFVMPAHGGPATNLTNFSEGFAADAQPSWSPNGSRIAFMSNRVPVDNIEIFVMDADGENQANLTQNQAPDHFPVWSPRP
jgi:Tol biopolymer transport system component